MNIFFDIIGLTGVACYVYGFVGLQILGWQSHGYRYLTCNSMGAVLTLISLTYAFNLASFVSQIIFLLISIVSIWQIKRPNIDNNPLVDNHSLVVNSSDSFNQVSTTHIQTQPY